MGSPIGISKSDHSKRDLFHLISPLDSAFGTSFEWQSLLAVVLQSCITCLLGQLNLVLWALCFDQTILYMDALLPHSITSERNSSNLIVLLWKGFTDFVKVYQNFIKLFSNDLINN